MGSFGSYSFLVGPIIAMIAVGGLLLVAKWMTGGTASLIAADPRAGAAEEYGLMIPVASPHTEREAASVTARLASAEVRAKSVRTTQGLRVMVWAEDVSRARAVLDPPGR